MKRLAIAMLALAACSNTPTERYGFVTTLGSDTVSVESVTRHGSTITSDEVDRFPRVRQRHATIELNDDETIRHLVMDIHTPSEPENQRDRHVEADVSGSSITVTKKDASATVKRTYNSGGTPALAHLPQMYSLYELYFAAAAKRAASAEDTVKFRQFYIDREFDNFPLHRATVVLHPGSKAEIRHDWLSGIGDATLDSAHHLVAYTGSRTTYDVRVARVDSIRDIKSIGDRFAANEAKNGAVKPLSVRDTTRATIGAATFMVDYGRPLARGRMLLGNVIRFNSVWRTGANAATQFSTSAPITLGTLSIPAGTYTLWSVPRENGSAELIVNKQTGQWGTEYNSSLNLGRTSLKTETVSAPVEEFTISIIPADARRGLLVLDWGTFKWSAPIALSR
jgi:hypothetical protein